MKNENDEIWKDIFSDVIDNYVDLHCVESFNLNLSETEWTSSPVELFTFRDWDNGTYRTRAIKAYANNDETEGFIINCDAYYEKDISDTPFLDFYCNYTHSDSTLYFIPKQEHIRREGENDDEEEEFIRRNLNFWDDDDDFDITEEAW